MLGYQGSDSENAYDFFLAFFFSIRATDPISGNAFDGKRKQKKGDGLAYLNRFPTNKFNASRREILPGSLTLVSLFLKQSWICLKDCGCVLVFCKPTCVFLG